MRCLVYTFLLTLSFNVISAQTDSTLVIHKINTLQANITNFSTDNLGNIYVINSFNQIKKYNAKGDSMAVYNDGKRYGNIYSIDASNPLKVLVYYKDFTTVVMLDRLLNVRNTIDLRKQNIYQVQAVATSYDGNFWLYDELAGKIKKVDDYGKVIMESADLRMALPTPPQPFCIYDRDGLLYLYDSTQGIFVFDYYGAIKNTYALKNISDLQVIDKNTITGRQGSYIILYKPLTMKLYKFKTGDHAAAFRQVMFNGNRLYALTGLQEVEIYDTQ